MNGTVNAVSTVEIALIHKLLEQKFGILYADIWKIGVNLGLRIGDLLSLKFTDFDIEARTLNIFEQKTGKKKSLRLNKTVIEIICARQIRQPGDIWLFQVHSNRAKNKAVSIVSVSRVFKDCGDILGLHVNTHSMRKSRGKAMFDAGVPLEKIAKVLNHGSPGVTMRYIGIDREQIMQTYDDFEL